MKKLFFAFVIVFMNAQLYAQTLSNTIFTNGDDINVELDSNSEYFYVHKIEKGQSLYALSEIFNIPLHKIYQINNLRKGATIGIGQQIKIPILDNYLFKGVNLSGLKYGHYIPVYYKTKPKDNLFRISRIYFNQPTEDLVKRNNLKNNDLALGQNILVGWFPIDGSTPIEAVEEFEEDLDFSDANQDVEVIDSNSSVEDSMVNPDGSDLETVIDTSNLVETLPEGFNLSLLGRHTYSESMKLVERAEVAHWDKAMPDNGTVYVLHKDAIIDSYIELYNPLLKRSVRAKVIGRIPYGAYTNDVRLVLSPRTAKQLRALDKRFKVEVKALVYESE